MYALINLILLLIYYTCGSWVIHQISCSYGRPHISLGGLVIICWISIIQWNMIFKNFYMHSTIENKFNN